MTILFFFKLLINIDDDEIVDPYFEKLDVEIELKFLQMTNVAKDDLFKPATR